MDFAKIKKYPSQISTAFKRFPLASALAIFTFYAFAIICEPGPSHSNDSVKPFVWLGIYPIAAMLIAVATTLFQESRKSTSRSPQIITGSIWLVVSAVLMTYVFSEDESNLFYFTSTVALVYIVAIFSIFFAPFWKQKDENGIWNFLQKNIKAFITAVIISAILLGAIEGLIFGFAGLFDTFFDEKIYFYTFLFCSCTVLPILYFTGIPSIDECLEEVPSLNKFATSTIRFLFIPVLAIGILLFYAYIVKFIAQWDMPEGVVSAFVSGFMVYMLALVTAMYPHHLASSETLEKRLLKVFPAACIPFAVLMSIDIATIMRDSDIEEEFFYIIAVNIYFYAVLAILLAGKIKRKFRYIALTFCALFFICTDSPLNAPSITRHIWLNSIEDALIEQGYTQFPLNEEDKKAFIDKLRKSNDENSKTVFSRIKKIDDIYLTSYFTGKISPYAEPESSSAESDTTKAFETFEVDIMNSEINSFIIPEGAKEVIILNHHFDKDEFEYNGDTLTFQITISEDDESADSTKAGNASDSSATASSDATVADSAKTKSKVYSFRTTKQELNDSLVSIATDHASIGIKRLNTNQWSETDCSLHIKGLLFIE